MVTHLDPEQIVTAWLGVILAAPAFVGWEHCTDVAPGVTPEKLVQVRQIGGVGEARVAVRPRIDIRVWGSLSDPSADINTKQTARTLCEALRGALNARVVLIPTLFPDVADSRRLHAMFTLELLTRGVNL